MDVRKPYGTEDKNERRNLLKLSGVGKVVEGREVSPGRDRRVTTHLGMREKSGAKA